MGLPLKNNISLVLYSLTALLIAGACTSPYPQSLEEWHEAFHEPNSGYRYQRVGEKLKYSLTLVPRDYLSLLNVAKGINHTADTSDHNYGSFYLDVEVREEAQKDQASLIQYLNWVFTQKERGSIELRFPNGEIVTPSLFELEPVSNLSGRIRFIITFTEFVKSSSATLVFENSHLPEYQIRFNQVDLTKFS